MWKLAISSMVATFGLTILAGRGEGASQNTTQLELSRTVRRLLLKNNPQNPSSSSHTVTWRGKATPLGCSTLLPTPGAAGCAHPDADQPQELTALTSPHHFEIFFFFPLGLLFPFEQLLARASCSGCGRTAVCWGRS